MNWERYYVYGAWWKSPEEVQSYLDGNYVYSIEPKDAWGVPAFIQMAIEIYDWNPVPEDGGLVETGTWEQRTTQYDWMRTWKLADKAVAPTETSPADLPADYAVAIRVFAEADMVKVFVNDRYSLVARLPAREGAARAREQAFRWHASVLCDGRTGEIAGEMDSMAYGSSE